MEMTVSSQKSDQPRKESGNQLPHSKLMAKVELKRGFPIPQKSVSSDERVLSVSVFSPEGGRS